MKQALWVPLLIGLSISTLFYGVPRGQMPVPNSLPKPNFGNLLPARPVHPVVPHIKIMFREYNAFRTADDVDYAVAIFLMNSANLNNNNLLSPDDKLEINNVKDAVRHRYPQLSQNCGLDRLMDEE